MSNRYWHVDIWRFSSNNRHARDVVVRRISVVREGAKAKMDVSVSTFQQQGRAHALCDRQVYRSRYYGSSERDIRVRSGKRLQCQKSVLQNGEQVRARHTTRQRKKKLYSRTGGNLQSHCIRFRSANNKINANTTFLVGAEALDEVVGDLKVQLSPKTNFWSNAAGALNVAKAVMDMLRPLKKVTILEIGCGLGVVGLMMAPVSTHT